METIYVILIALLIVGGSILFYYLKRKDMLKNFDTAETVIYFGIAMASDLGLDEKKDLDKLKNILLETLEYVKVISDYEHDKEKIINEAILKAKEMCIVLDLELNENREFIIETVVVACFNLYSNIEDKKQLKQII